MELSPRETQLFNKIVMKHGKFNFHKRIGAPSQNSSVYLISDETNAKYSVLKISDLSSDDAKIFYINRKEITSRLGQDSSVNKFVVLPYVADLISDITPLVGYSIEPYLNHYDTFENKVVEWYERTSSSELNFFLINIKGVFENIFKCIYYLYTNHGFNHNDLHLNNVMVNDSCDIKLIDFDWATMFKGGESQVPLYLIDFMYYPKINSLVTSVCEKARTCTRNASTCTYQLLEQCEQSLFESLFNKTLHPCNYLHYSVHLAYSREFFDKKQPSPRVDLAKFFINFLNIFVSPDTCEQYNTASGREVRSKLSIDVRALPALQNMIDIVSRYNFDIRDIYKAGFIKQLAGALNTKRQKSQTTKKKSKENLKDKKGK